MRTLELKCVRCHREEDLSLFPFGAYLCTPCASNTNIIYCIFCEKFFEISHSIFYDNEIFHICEECFAIHAQRFFCSGCEEELIIEKKRIEENKTVQEVMLLIKSKQTFCYKNEKWFCDDCWRLRLVCEQCDRLAIKTQIKTPYDYSTEWEGEILYCNFCIAKMHKRCKECKRYYLKECYCYTHIIQRYSKQIDFLPGLIPSQRYTERLLLFGLESEFYTRSNHIAKKAAVFLSRYDPWAIFKGDASIRPFGVEAITIPASYEWWISQKQQVKAYFGKAKSLGCGVNHTTGMHLHLSRGAFTSKKHLYLFYRLVYFYPFAWLKLSQRDLKRLDRINEYTRFHNIRLDAFNLSYAAANTYDNSEMSRHSALVTREKTLEFRVFSSTLDGDRIVSRIELIKSLFDYTKMARIESVLNDWLEFLEKGDYPLAQTYVQECGIKEKDLISPDKNSKSWKRSDLVRYAELETSYGVVEDVEEEDEEDEEERGFERWMSLDEEEGY